jgi:hypothetical protein
VLTISKASQTITFNPIPSKAYGDADFTIDAKASSNLTLTFTSSDINVAKISGNKVTIVGVGTSTITASQAGNEFFNAAVDVQQLLTVDNAPTKVKQLNRKVNLYPNPSDGHFVFDLDGEQPGYVEIENTTGRVVFFTTITNDRQLIDISPEPNGMYLIKLRIKSELYTYKMIKSEL